MLEPFRSQEKHYQEDKKDIPDVVIPGELIMLEGFFDPDLEAVQPKHMVHQG